MVGLSIFTLYFDFDNILATECAKIVSKYSLIARLHPIAPLLLW